MTTTKTAEQRELPHHFDSAEQEYESGKIGIWLFLITEILMFSGLFVGYAIYRTLYPEAWSAGSALLDVRLGGLNTVVLISSSLSMALAVNFTQRGQIKKAIPSLVITLLLAGTFMVIKYFEYAHKFHDGLLPGPFFTYEGGVENLKLFFGAYFGMTGLHGIHVLIGMALITWTLIRLKRGQFGPNYYLPLEGVGLYWHIVDIFWIYLFPLLYLIG